MSPCQQKSGQRSAYTDALRSESLSLFLKRKHNGNTHFGEDPVGEGGLVERQAPAAAQGDAAAQTVGHGAGVDGRLAQDRCLQAGRRQAVKQ